MKSLFRICHIMLIWAVISCSFHILSPRAAEVQALDTESAIALPLIVDGGKFLSHSETSALLNRLNEIKKNENIEIIIVTRSSIGQKTASEYASDFFKYNGYGPDSVMLLISGDERVWAVSTHGTATKIFTSALIDEMMDIVFTHLSTDDFYEAFESFTDICEDIIYADKNNLPINISEEVYRVSLVDLLPINLLIAIILALIIIKGYHHAYQDSSLPPDEENLLVCRLSLEHKYDKLISSNISDSKLDSYINGYYNHEDSRKKM